MNHPAIKPKREFQRAAPPRQSGDFVWTEEKWEQLKSLAGGSLSARQIAEVMGISRNAVVGACSRRGIRLSGNASVQTARRIYQRKQDLDRKIKRATEEIKPIYKARKEPVVEPLPPTFTPLDLHLWEMDRWQCRYSTGEDNTGFYFCGHQTPIGSPWCSHHRPKLFCPTPLKRIKVKI